MSNPAGTGGRQVALNSRAVATLTPPSGLGDDFRRLKAMAYVSNPTHRSLDGCKSLDLSEIDGTSSASSICNVSIKVLPAIDSILTTTFQLSALRGAKIMVTPPAKGQRPHCHRGESLKGVTRLHVILRTNPSFLFGEGSAAFHVPEGTVVSLERADLHWEFNSGATHCMRIVCDFDSRLTPEECLRPGLRKAVDLIPVKRAVLPAESSRLFREAARKVRPETVEGLLAAAETFFMFYDARPHATPWDLLMPYLNDRSDCMAALCKLGGVRQSS